MKLSYVVRAATVALQLTSQLPSTSALTHNLHSARRTQRRTESPEKVLPLPGSDTLRKRFDNEDTASSSTWSTFLTKGSTMLCGLVATDKAAGMLMRDRRDPPSAESIWKGGLEQEMKTWFWHDLPEDGECDIGARWDIEYALQSLGLDNTPASQGGDNVCISVEHKANDGMAILQQKYTVDEKEYTATGARYDIAVAARGGAIYCFYVTSPRYAASSYWYGNKKDPDVNDLPKLRALSDMMWGYWNRNNADIKNIRYFFMIGIYNDQTNRVIATALKNAKKELREWPGVKFSTSGDEGKALLGSPNGATFAYFLMQHKTELGYKTITEVSVFRPENDDESDFVDVNLVFHVADAPEPPPDKPAQALNWSE